MQWQLYSLLVYHLLLSVSQDYHSSHSMVKIKVAFDIDNKSNRCIPISFINPVEIIIIHYLVQDMEV